MTTPLWTSDELVAAMDARLDGPVAPATGASIDTRTLEPGDLFFAIQGEARDGHDFVASALAKGAAAAVVASDRAAELAGSGPLVVVDDVLEAMRRLGVAARRRAPVQAVAVTGSVGKTGTKEALRLALTRQRPTHASVASYNNHWGVPLTLARMPRETRYGVFEVGMNHAGEIAPLTRLIRPHVALVTTVEPVHIEFFRSLSGIADAKGEIFGGLEPGGTAVLPRDNPHYERLRAHALSSAAGRIVTFGEHADADIRAERIVVEPGQSIVEARVLGTPLLFRVGMPGRHIAVNALGALGVVKALGADLALAGLALAELTPPVGRGERTRLHLAAGEAILIDESYNANPASMRAALAALAATKPGSRGRRVAVLGDMLELGPEGPSMHGALQEPAAVADIVFAAGPLMRHLVDALPPERRGGYAATAAELEPEVLAALRPGDVVMIKGSNGVRMSRIVQALKARFGPDAVAARQG
ncbi:MAG TPA: UDP-N-acetylmuramoylalanyl-D-glutamyl-2,6-diaminopimelate--D-alanyl-D-alanine ligase [Beijerinckiaceae bacterium]|jgi:UDP-N-acetylmuramoyl-tripeptide--D-alanyl-D-alanine ligase